MSSLYKQHWTCLSKQSSEIWGAHGYHFTENGEHVWGDLSIAVGEAASKQGFLKTAAPGLREWFIDEAVNSPAGFEAASWGMNSRVVAERAKKVLGWKPQAKTLSEKLQEIVRSEAARMGL